MIDQIATISTNNDKDLGKLISYAFKEVGETGVVIMEPGESGITEVDIVEGVEYSKVIHTKALLLIKKKYCRTRKHTGVNNRIKSRIY